MRAEGVQEKGRKGVFQVKRWLESTTHMEFPFDAYGFTATCTPALLNGEHKTYDLFGSHLTRRVPLYVEVKDYASASGLSDEYWEFLANSYSVSANINVQGLGPANHEFIWVTTHPFDQTNWTKLTSRERLYAAVSSKHPEVLGTHGIDESLVTNVAQRIWLLVVNSRQAELTLSAEELAKVHGVLGRKAD